MTDREKIRDALDVFGAYATVVLVALVFIALIAHTIWVCIYENKHGDVKFKDAPHKIRWILCHGLGWHVPDDGIYGIGINNVSKCKHCGRYIIQDSQGGWFESSQQDVEKQLIERICKKQ